MADEMFFSNDERTLIRGRRVASRTETCRPCVIGLANGERLEGVILNLNPHGLLVRIMSPLEVGSAVEVRMMRDDAFREPLAAARYGKVVRHDASDGAFFDLAIKLDNPEIPKAPERRAPVDRPRAVSRPQPSRMHTLDLTIGDNGPRRTRR